MTQKIINNFVTNGTIMNYLLWSFQKCILKNIKLSLKN